MGNKSSARNSQQEQQDYTGDDPSEETGGTEAEMSYFQMAKHGYEVTFTYTYE